MFLALPAKVRENASLVVPASVCEIKLDFFGIISLVGLISTISLNQKNVFLNSTKSGGNL